MWRIQNYMYMELTKLIGHKIKVYNHHITVLLLSVLVFQ